MAASLAGHMPVEEVERVDALLQQGAQLPPHHGTVFLCGGHGAVSHQVRVRGAACGSIHFQGR